MRTLLKRTLPAPTRAFLRARFHDIVTLPERARNWGERQISPRFTHLLQRLTFAPYARRSWETIVYAALRNTLPNTGAVPMEQRFSSAAEIVAAFPDQDRRTQDLAGFAGFAPDDAVFDPAKEMWQLWSSVRLAGFLTRFGYTHYENPTALELGCGPAHLFFFFRQYGLKNYVGVDGHPDFVRFNPYLRGFEQHFIILNLQQEIRLNEGASPRTFDMVCSFEVLEHIQEAQIDHMIQSIRNHMHARSVAFCTTSLQDVYDVHVLVRERGWWLERFARHGLYPRDDAAELTRELGRRHPFNWHPGISEIYALQTGGAEGR